MQNPFETLEQKLNQLTSMVTDLGNKLSGQQSVDLKPLNVSEAAKYLDMAKPTLYALTSKREIPHMKRGKKLYFNQQELDNWLKEHRKKTATEIRKEGI